MFVVDFILFFPSNHTGEDDPVYSTYGREFVREGSDTDTDTDLHQQCYEYDMVQEGKPIEDYLCCICFGMIRDAVEMPCCKKFIGNACRLRTLTNTFREHRYLRLNLQ